ncbi:IAA-amino acid hydrolase ILR1-like 9 [Lasiodiplodia hormozganensis]|uniref:IAA-amino acid hydrolase ILR1-like 9 n=1 Tax=Lasiodiplodia hormozganensis TaxID=869390 RepID=A0AA39Y8D1_9PEZI|nr:IAA-amino acid hydrolase ILR1-like 9 [Lasiodiplodia hormozganensis]
MSEISETINTYRPDLTSYEEFYKHLHRNPELSFQERETAATILARLTSLLDAFPSIKTSIHTEIGSYGLAAILHNQDPHGSSPTVLLRADMDALPVEEQTRLELKIHGRSGHASQPHRTCDPIVTAAHTIVRLQSIAAREVDPEEGAVVSVGYIHAGNAVNVIPDTAHVGIDVRTFSPDTRAHVLGALRRIVNAESAAAGAPPPELVEERAYPFLVNDEMATRKVEDVFSAHFGDAYDANAQGLGGSEDFGVLATAVGRPSVYFMYGATDQRLWERLENEGELQAVPSTHSASFAPVLETLRFGVDAYTGAALAFLKR